MDNFMQGGVASDFRSHTCGECAWAYVWKEVFFTCRREGWMNPETGDGHPASMPACPAYIAREKRDECWQPIETLDKAQKRNVILYSRSDGQHEGYWEPFDSEWCDASLDGGKLFPTHWRPLPQPPMEKHDE